MTDIHNGRDLIDSRDVIERIEELREDLAEWGDDDERDELRKLEALAAQASGYAADWQHGEVLIRDSYFVEYAQDLAEECGMLENCGSWPATCIDWAQAARELQTDYTAVDFDGVTYWIR